MSTPKSTRQPETTAGGRTLRSSDERPPAARDPAPQSRTAETASTPQSDQPKTATSGAQEHRRRSSDELRSAARDPAPQSRTAETASTPQSDPPKTATGGAQEHRRRSSDESSTARDPAPQSGAAEKKSTPQDVDKEPGIATGGQPEHRLHSSEEPLPTADEPASKSPAMETGIDPQRKQAEGPHHDEHPEHHRAEAISYPPGDPRQRATGVGQSASGEAATAKSTVQGPHTLAAQMDTSPDPHRQPQPKHGEAHIPVVSDVQQQPQQDPVHPEPQYSQQAGKAGIHPSTSGQVAAGTYTSGRPQDVRPTAQAGGVAGAAQPDKPTEKVPLADRILGKVEKATGKIFEEPGLHQKGELRETAGKGAVKGGSRPLHG